MRCHTTLITACLHPLLKYSTDNAFPRNWSLFAHPRSLCTLLTHLQHGEASPDTDSVKALYEGDPQHLLPLIFLANAYESLVADVTARMAGLEAFKGKSMGMALEASGGLYRRIVEKFPKSGKATLDCEIRVLLCSCNFCGSYITYTH